jgi:hypothetical protein
MEGVIGDMQNNAFRTNGSLAERSAEEKTDGI